MKISIAKDFSEVPAGRFVADGEFSGERFRNEFLRPALVAAAPGEKLEIDIDGTAGYGSSFLEEVFGGLVRSGFSAEDLHRRVTIVSQDPAFSMYRTAIWRYIDRAGVGERDHAA